MNDEEMAHGEIIIVRRGGGDHEDEHHGGVWKIAFADFMTAMMAFFLVMWLINASNEETKKAVASYFNPVKLMDTTSNPKGVRSPKYGNPSDDAEEVEESTQITKPSSAADGQFESPKSFDEQALFVDPYAVLAEIAGGFNGDNEAIKSSEKEKPMGDGGGKMGLSGGASFQDPFDPSSWSMEHGEPVNDSFPDEAAKLEEIQDQPGKTSGSMNLEQASLEEPNSEDLATELRKANDAEPASENAGKADSDTGPDGPVNTPETVPSEQAQKVEIQTTEIREAVLELKLDESLSGLDIEITSTADGTQITFSDQSANGMFNIGSAQPTPELVNVMAKIGSVIGNHPGTVTIAGHTDGRKYQSEDYDNWRLSTARAHMAFYMLVRGGMSESKVSQIVGQADTSLKMPEEPYASANRRIEVHLLAQ